MKLTVKALALICLLVGASQVLFASNYTLELTGVGGNNLGGVYVYPYIFSLSPAGAKAGTGPTVYLACDDFYDDITVGESWQVTETYLADLTSSSNVYFNASVTGSFAATKTDYNEVAWLYQQMVGYQAANNAGEVADINWAIWDIFDPGASSSGKYGTISPTDQGNISKLLGQAQTAVANGYIGDVIIYTPVNCTAGGPGCPQEFIGVVPEPGTLLLLGTGLCSLLGLRRRFSL